MTTNKISYFAYGSNLCFSRLVSRCSSARFSEVGKLEGYKVVFNKKSKDCSGKANIVACDLECVYGVLYVIDMSDIGNLDDSELGYSRESSFKIQTRGGAIDANTYVAKNICTDPNLRPYDWYIDLIKFGAVKSGLPEKYIEILNSVVSIPDPDKKRSSSERLFLR